MGIQAHRSFRTEATSAETFAFLADFTNTRLWDPATVSCVLVSGDGGAGSEYRNVSRFLGRDVELDYRTLAHLPDEKLHFQGANKTFTGDDWITLRPEGTGTRVDYRVDFRLHGAARLATPVMAAYLPRLADRTIAQLQHCLDGVHAAA